MAKNIRITDNRYGDSFRTGINGLLYDIPLNQDVLVEDALADHIRGLGVAFEEPRSRDAKGASGSEEGSKDQLAPIGRSFGGASLVEAPAMRSQSLDNSGGTQPGDVTGSATAEDEDVLDPREGEPVVNPIEVAAEVSDVRVAGERRAHQQASVAEIAGEGEGGTTPADGGEPPVALAASRKSSEAAKQERVAPKSDKSEERR